MCGFCGFIDNNSALGRDQLGSVLAKMTDQIIHRGPDDSGYWIDHKSGVGLGHRRLSILDLSPEGHQPMVSCCGRFVIAFNGEIYNYREIRRKLEGESDALQWRGHSDTEVMLAAITRFGLKGALEQFNGMFAFALWDREERILSLARDRLGEKPLYYGIVNNVLLFGSELKTLRAHPAWQCEIDRRALALFMRHNNIPAPHSIFKGIHKLIPGTYITYCFNGKAINSTGPERYWSAHQIAEYGSANLLNLSDIEAGNELEAILSDSIRLRMEADVPIGAFLSGGVDSSIVVALMQEQSSRPVRSFSIGFGERDYDETVYARAVARHLGTDHTELYVSSSMAMAVIPRLPQLYDEPFSDASQIPTFLVSQMTREHVTVALSGDGGDELFGGYTRYLWAMNIRRIFKLMPRTGRTLLAKVLNRLKPQTWDELFRILRPVIPANLKQKMSGDKIKKLADVIVAKSPELMYQNLLAQWHSPENVVIGGNEPPTTPNDQNNWPNVNDFLHFMMYRDLVGYMPDDILTKVDRASMGVGLEARVPFLDHRVVEFAWQIPSSQKIRGKHGKWLLKEVLYRHVPRELIERPKMGFAIPIADWLRGPLRDWGEDLLAENRLRREGFFNPVLVRQVWDEHMSGTRKWQYRLWAVLMFQAWLNAEN